MTDVKLELERARCVYSVHHIHGAGLDQGIEALRVNPEGSMAETQKTVAVLGGGVAGLSAAHHLSERGYRVSVFEAKGATARHLGGKARSYVYRGGQEIDGASAGDDVDDLSAGKPMFGEHGFRFFPGFYSHVIDTMRHIDGPGAGKVADLLRPLEETGFYAQAVDSPPRGRGTRPLEWYARIDAWLFKIGSLLFLGWLAWGCLLFYWGAPFWWYLVWLGATVAWLVVRTVLVGLTASPGTELCLDLPVGERRGREDSWLQRWLLRVYPCGRFLGVAAVLASLAVFDRPWRLLPLVLLGAAAVWWYPALATLNYLWGVVGKIPINVRPGVLESVVAFLRVAAVVTSSPKRLYSQWENNSWWSFIEAYRYSRYFRLAFATGLTRGFVATRAELMSARTGATILTQLLFDASPTLKDRRNAADRVLCAPTHEAWIIPWVSQLDDKGVRFNVFEGDPTPRASVEVTSLVMLDGGNRIGGFKFVDSRHPDSEPKCAPETFDHYVLAVSGTAAQRILANSPELVRADRKETNRPDDQLGTPETKKTSQGKKRTTTPVPYLDGIFKLQFGWMSGIVFHLDEEITLPHGHLLCLESEWALTAVEQRCTWDDPPSMWQALVSVNVSDWFSASNEALPARFETMDAVADETWRQLRSHIPALRGIDETPQHVADTAINDPDPVAEARNLPTLVGPTTTTAVLENLELVNDEKLLVNTAGSWDDRPTARTAFDNLVIAGDYVRTWTDFASMESADEAARRAVNAILKIDKSDQRPCDVWELPIPRELKLPIEAVRAIDKIVILPRWPHPLMLLATPIGWGAGIEVNLRRSVRKSRGLDEPPV